jgi:hypothetical protein
MPTASYPFRSSKLRIFFICAPALCAWIFMFWVPAGNTRLLGMALCFVASVLVLKEARAASLGHLNGPQLSASKATEAVGSSYVWTWVTDCQQQHGVVDVSWDGQTFMLLRLRLFQPGALGRKTMWLWAEQQAAPEYWGDFRRAIYSSVVVVR